MTLAMPDPARPRSVIRSVLKSRGINVISFIFSGSRPTFSSRDASMVCRMAPLICAMSAIDAALVPAYRADSPAIVC